MKRILLFFIFGFFIFYLSPVSVNAAAFNDIVINEIAWMGTTTSANDEWIELFNSTNNTVSLDKWMLKSADEKIKINLRGEIKPKSFYLLERTDDNSVLAEKADLIYQGALNNNGQHLRLYDNLGNIIDEIDASLKWPAGDNTSKQTMEKTGSGWQTSKNPGGTPKAENNTKSAPLTNTTPQINKTLQTEKNYPGGIIINEILPSPQGADEINEWIELYNSNSFDIDLQNWKIEDLKGATSTYAFLKDIKILSNGYLVLKRTETKITLNNDGDSLNLISPDGKVVDSVTYEKTKTNQSYNKTFAQWQWSKTLTPGSENIVETQNNLAKKEKSDNNPNTAAVSEVNQENKNFLNPWFLFLIALSLTIISAVIVLLLKVRFKKVSN